MARKIQPRSKVPKPKKGQTSEDYWRERETRQRAANIHDEARYASRINDIFQSTQDSIQQEIESFYQRYAGKEGIDIAEARRRVSKIDMEKYERLAAQYVKAAHEGGREAAFSDEANEQMRLYNATMRINRLEMLKARCGIRAMEGYRLADQLINEALEERAYSEYYRLAGILGNSVQFNETMVRSIVDASYQNATWSKRLWINQALLSERIGAQIAQGILTGKGSDVLARSIQKLTGGSTFNCQRLMRTELRRVQTAAAEQSMLDNGVTEYKFMVANGVNPCDECLALDGKVFKISEMSVGKNAPPKHPLCHCCTCPALDEEKWQRWLDGPAQAGVPWAEFESDIINDNPLEVPSIVGANTGTKDEKDAMDALAKGISDVTNALLNGNKLNNHILSLVRLINNSTYEYNPNHGRPISYIPSRDMFYFTDQIIDYLNIAKEYVITHDVSHRMDELYYQSSQNTAFLNALELCAEKAYPRKKEIESWFEPGGKYEFDYALSDAFDALFFGNIRTITSHKPGYYTDNPDKVPKEIFADLSSSLALGECNEDLLQEVVVAFKLMVK